jgi:hypothetical protein
MNKPNESFEGPSQRRSWWNRNWFYTALILIAIIGSLCAFCLPLFIAEPFSAGDSVAALRQAILAATGGVLAMLTLWENRRKNLQEKEKNDLDHARQVKAERRSRYAKAIEQLADDKAPIRRGGIYTLAKLVDEWLADNKTVPAKEERLSEGQVIIDSLCAYIRSSYPLSIHKKVLERSHEPVDYPGNFLLDQAKFREEQEVRQLIIKEITKRLNDGSAFEGSKPKRPQKGPWSDFTYDFSKATFFYMVDFKNSFFNKDAIFNSAKFIHGADFNNSHFKQSADFENSGFSGPTGPAGSAKFLNSKFESEAKFRGSFFVWDAHFNDTVFSHKSSFENVRFNKKAIFSDTLFEQSVIFKNTYFAGGIKFFREIFKKSADFSSSYFFHEANFFKAEFHQQPIFKSINLGITYTAQFSYKDCQINFSVSTQNGAIQIKTTKVIDPNKNVFILPEGAELFNPDDPDDFSKGMVISPGGRG